MWGENMFLINNEEFSRIKKELEVSIIQLEKSKLEERTDKYSIYLQKYVLDRKIKIYEFLIEECIYLERDIISLLERRVKHLKYLRKNIE